VKSSSRPPASCPICAGGRREGAATRAGARSTLVGQADLLLLAQAALPRPRLRAELHRVSPELPPPTAGHPPLPAAPLRAGAVRRACRDPARNAGRACPSHPSGTAAGAAPIRHRPGLSSLVLDVSYWFEQAVRSEPNRLARSFRPSKSATLQVDQCSELADCSTWRVRVQVAVATLAVGNRVSPSDTSELVRGLFGAELSTAPRMRA
jgi:hypothetical protein